jgi:hypothetical protein
MAKSIVGEIVSYREFVDCCLSCANSGTSKKKSSGFLLPCKIDYSIVSAFGGCDLYVKDKNHLGEKIESLKW